MKPLRSTKPPNKAYIYKKANFDGLNYFISKSPSEFFASNPCGNSVEQNWNSFKHAVTTGISQFIPQKSSKPKFSLPWITPKIKREMRKKNRLDHWKAFKRQRNSVSNLIKDSHNSYLNDVIGDSLTENPKKFWFHVKHSRSENLGIPPLKTEEGVFVTDKDKAETLNSYFFSVFTNEQLPLPKIPISPYSSIVDLHTSPEGIAKQLSQLNPNKACGPDELPARVLKEISQSASGWFAFIFQQSLNLNTVPSDWSKALITAVYKKDNKSLPSNYRPISLTSNAVK